MVSVHRSRLNSLMGVIHITPSADGVLSESLECSNQYMHIEAHIEPCIINKYVMIDISLHSCYVGDEIISPRNN
jgi:hypothetical protein